MKRKEIEDKLNKRLGLKRIGWLTNIFEEVFESNYVTKRITQEKALKILKNFLRDQNMKELIFFPDQSLGWISYDSRIKKENDPISFESINDAMMFLERQILYGAENYYITNQNIDYILTICHEEDFHISGSKEFTGKFKENYLL